MSIYEQMAEDGFYTAGPFTMLPEGACLHPDIMPPLELGGSMARRIFPEGVEHACPYCKSIYTGFRCHSCGAPRQAPKIHTICTTS